jgi:predicted O-methyltransferase YrrM
MSSRIKTITRTEFGRVISSRYSVPFARKVTMLIPKGLTPVCDQRILYRTARSIKPKMIFEIGTHYGTVTMGLYLNSFCADVYTFDICKEMGIPVPLAQELDILPRKKIGRVLGKNIPGIHRFLCDSRDIRSYTILKGKAIDLAFIDGNHTCGAVVKDTCNVLRFTKKNSIIFWHDFDISGEVSGVREALEKIVSAKKLRIYHINKTSLAFTIL